MEATPPVMEVPPITQPAMASLLKVSPSPGWTVVFFATKKIAAIPAIMPCIMAGNALLVSCICLLKSRFKGKSGLLFSMLIGCLLKALFMGIAISLLLIPAFLPEKMHPQMRVFQMTFSVVQLVTAVTGIVYAMILQIPIRKYLNREA